MNIVRVSKRRWSKIHNHITLLASKDNWPSELEYFYLNVQIQKQVAFNMRGRK